MELVEVVATVTIAAVVEVVVEAAVVEVTVTAIAMVADTLMIEASGDPILDLVGLHGAPMVKVAPLIGRNSCRVTNALRRNFFTK